MTRLRNAIIVVAGILLVGLVLVASQTLAVSVGGHEIVFVEVLYDDPNPGQSTWFYSVTSGSQPAISHVVFELNLDCMNVLEAGTWDGTDVYSRTVDGGDPEIRTSPDPTTGLIGIKFDQGFNDGETRHYYFTVDGNYAEGQITVATKAGQDVDTAQITGPNSDCRTVLVLGDEVWYDVDQDGEQDAGEPGVQGITAKLYSNAGCTGSPVMTDTTDASGNYLFTGLVTGTYCIEFAGIPTMWEISPKDAAPDDVDSDAVAVGAATAQITGINFTTHDLTQDMGIYRPGEIGDTVWCDADLEGDFDAGEGMADITVTLHDDPNCDGDETDGSVISTTVTSGDGQYVFSRLETGPPDCGLERCYVVKVDTADTDLGACNIPITPVEHATALCASDPTDYEADFGFREFRLGQEDRDLDFGDAPDSSNNWGSSMSDQYGGGPGTGNFPTTISNTTASNNLYGFCHVLSDTGSYLGTSVTPEDVDADVPPDSDPTVNISPTVDLPDLDLGDDAIEQPLVLHHCEPLSVPVKVTIGEDLGESSLYLNLWFDWNRDGDWGNDVAGDASMCTVTDDTPEWAVQNYALTGLVSGTHTISVTVKPWNPWPNNASPMWLRVTLSEERVPGDELGGQSGGLVEQFCFNDGETEDHLLEPELFDLGDRVWYDTNRDGEQHLLEVEEPGVSGITVTLYDDDCSGQSITSTTTDNLGKYLFTRLLSDTYCIEFSGILPGWEITAQNAGGVDDDKDSDADPANGRIENIALMADDLTQDMGLHRPGTIGDTVWCDADGEGDFDVGEGLNGITVTLYSDPNCNGEESDGEVLSTTVTTGDGDYLFSDLETGPPDCGQRRCYVVRVDENDEQLGDCNLPITPVKHATALCATDYEDLEADFGFEEPVTICGFVYNDLNRNGMRDPGEPPIPDVLITLEDDQGNLVAQRTTDDTGGYCFRGYRPGTYVVIEADPDGYESTNSVPGTGGTGEDVNRIRVEATMPGETYESQDFLDARIVVGGATLPARGVWRIVTWSIVAGVLGLAAVVGVRSILSGSRRRGTA